MAPAIGSDAAGRRSDRRTRCHAVRRERSADGAAPCGSGSARRSWSAERTCRPSTTAIFQDITDLERLDELNVRTERLEAVATLSASLAHEIKNPLASIRSRRRAAEPRPPLAGGDRAMLERLVLTESDRLSRLLSEFLDYSALRHERRDEQLDLHAIVAGLPAAGQAAPRRRRASRSSCRAATTGRSTFIGDARPAPSGALQPRPQRRSVRGARRPGRRGAGRPSVTDRRPRGARRSKRPIRLVGRGQRTRHRSGRARTASSTRSSRPRPGAAGWVSRSCTAPWRPTTARPSSSAARTVARRVRHLSCQACPKGATADGAGATSEDPAGRRRDRDPRHARDPLPGRRLRGGRRRLGAEGAGGAGRREARHRADRHPHAGSRRARGARPRRGGRSRDRRDPHDRAGVAPVRGAGGERGRLLLPAEAVRQRRAAGHLPAGGRGPAAQGREQAAQEGDHAGATRPRARSADREGAALHRGARAGGDRGAHRLDRPDLGRERDRARRSSPATSTRCPSGPTARSSPSTAAPSRRACSRASSSVT